MLAHCPNACLRNLSAHAGTWNAGNDNAGNNDYGNSNAGNSDVGNNIQGNFVGGAAAPSIWAFVRLSVICDES